jgi:hypothetical protein
MTAVVQINKRQVTARFASFSAGCGFQRSLSNNSSPDFFLFGHLKHCLKDSSFSSEEEYSQFHQALESHRSRYWRDWSGSPHIKVIPIPEIQSY